MRILAKWVDDIATLSSLLPLVVYIILVEGREHMSDMQVVIGESSSDEGVIKIRVLIVLCQFKL